MCQIANLTGVSCTSFSSLHTQYLSDLQKSSGSHLSKFSSSDICYATCLTNSKNTESAVQVIETLWNVKNTSISTQSIKNPTQIAGLKAVSKKKAFVKEEA